MEEDYEDMSENNDLVTASQKVESRNMKPQQQHAMLDILLHESNKAILLGNFNGETITKEKKQELWKQISIILNAMDGPTRTPQQWSDTFTVWRSKTKNKLVKLMEQARETGNGICTAPQLKELDKKMSNFISEVAIHGIPNIPVAGLGDLTPKHTASGIKMGQLPMFSSNGSLVPDAAASNNLSVISTANSPNAGPNTSTATYSQHIDLSNSINRKRRSQDTESLKKIGEEERNKRALQTTTCSSESNIAPKKSRTTSSKMTRKEGIMKLVQVIEKNSEKRDKDRKRREKDREKRHKEIVRMNKLQEEANEIKREKLRLQKEKQN